MWNFSYRWRPCLALHLPCPWESTIITKQKEIKLRTQEDCRVFNVCAQTARPPFPYFPGCKTQITLWSTVLQKEKRKDYIWPSFLKSLEFHPLKISLWEFPTMGIHLVCQERRNNLGFGLIFLKILFLLKERKKEGKKKNPLDPKGTNGALYDNLAEWSVPGRIHLCSPTHADTKSQKIWCIGKGCRGLVRKRTYFGASGCVSSRSWEIDPGWS